MEWTWYKIHKKKTIHDRQIKWHIVGSDVAAVV